MARAPITTPQVLWRKPPAAPQTTDTAYPCGFAVSVDVVRLSRGLAGLLGAALGALSAAAHSGIATQSRPLVRQPQLQVDHAFVRVVDLPHLEAQAVPKKPQPFGASPGDGPL